MRTISPKKVDWRKDASTTDFDPDDTELESTPRDVILALGFDPKDFSETEKLQASEGGNNLRAVLSHNEGNPNEAIRDSSTARYQSAVDDFTAHAKAIVLAKSKKKREQLKALFLLLMLDAAEESYKSVYPKLAVALTKKPGVGIPTLPKNEAEEFAAGRQQYLDKFPSAVFDKLDAAKQQSEHDGMSEKEIRAELNKAAEEIKSGRGQVLAETEAQVTYGSAEIKVLQRAGYSMKRWQTEEDDRVRNSHENCQLQGAIPIDAKFSNGLHHPGENGAPPEEVINCRCWLEGSDK